MNNHFSCKLFQTYYITFLFRSTIYKTFKSVFSTSFLEQTGIFETYMPARFDQLKELKQF